MLLPQVIGVQTQGQKGAIAQPSGDPIPMVPVPTNALSAGAFSTLGGALAPQLIGPPPLVAPANGAVTTTPNGGQAGAALQTLLTASAPIGANFIRFWLDDDAVVNDFPADQTNIFSVVVPVIGGIAQWWTPALGNGVWYWSAAGCPTSTGSCGTVTSPPRLYTIMTSPGFVGPPAGTPYLVSDTAHLDIANDGRYHLIMGSSSSNVAAVPSPLELFTQTPNAFADFTVPGPGTWYWTAQSCVNANYTFCSGRSIPSTFQGVAFPQSVPQSPVNGQTGVGFQPQLISSAVSITGGYTPVYDFQLATDPGFTNVLYQSGLGGLGVNSLVVPLNYLGSGQQVYWRTEVCTSNVAFCGGWGPAALFTTMSVPTSAPAAPQNGANVPVLTPTLSTTGVTMPDGSAPTYRYVLADNPNLTNPFFQVDSTATSVAVPAGKLAPGQTVFWAMLVCHKNGSGVIDGCGNYSALTRLTILPPEAVATFGGTTRVSQTAAGVAAGGLSPSVSDDGRFVAFLSSASNLVAGDTNAAMDVFVTDRQLGTTERVSVDSAGLQANGGASWVSVSNDGRFVAFLSTASNLVAGDANNAADVFVRDRQAGTTARVSVGAAGVEGNGPAVSKVAISGDGRFVAFTSGASNLVAGDTNALDDVFVRDRQAGTTERVSIATGAVEAVGGTSNDVVISPDGRFVVFASTATNLVAGDTNAKMDIFLRDRQTGTTERESVKTGGAQAGLAAGGSASAHPSVSPDGRFVAIQSDFTDLGEDVDTNAAFDIFVRDRQAGSTKRVSLSSTGGQADGNSLLPAISSDGRYVAFSSLATNLVVGDTNARYDEFRRDTQTGTTGRVSMSSDDAQGAAAATDAWGIGDISADGRFVVFDSLLNGLVAGDTAGESDAFVTDMAVARTKALPPPVPVAQTVGSCDNSLGATEASGCGRDDEVNGATGGYSDTTTDLSVPSIGVSFAFTRTYNSNDATVGVLGRGWTQPYAAKLTAYGNRDTILVKSEDGQQGAFYRNADGTYTSAPGLTSTLTYTALGDTYTLTTLGLDTQMFEGATGRVLTSKDEHGEGLSFHYDAGGRLDTVTDSAGRVATITYTAAGRIAQVGLSDGRSVVYGYSADAVFLTSVTDVRGKVTTYQYDLNSRLSKEIDPRLKARVTLTYGAGAMAGRMLTKTDATGNAVTYNWDPATGISTRTDARGNVWKQEFRGNLMVSETDPLGNKTEYGYDARLNRSLVRDARGNETRYGFDPRGNQTEVMPPAPFTYPEWFAYNAQNKLVSSTDRRGFTTSNVYAANGDLLETTDALGGKTTYTYTGRGLVATVKDERGQTSGKVTSYAYDPVTGDRTSMTSPMGFVTTYAYDASGRMTAETDPRGALTPTNTNDFKSTYTYNEADARLTVTDARANTTTYTYDLSGNPDSMTDAHGKTTTYTYDNANRRLSVIEPRSTGVTATTATEYDANGNASASVGANGQRTTFGYDKANRRTTVVTPRGNPPAAGTVAADFTWTTGYDANGNATSVADPAGNTTTSVFDKLNRVASVTNALGKTTSNALDGEGNVLSVTDAVGNTTKNEFDGLGRRTATTTPRGKRSTTLYDVSGNVLEQVSALTNKTKFTYDDDGRLATKVDPRGFASGNLATDYTWTYLYDQAGNQTRTTDPLGKTSDKAFDANDNQISETDANAHTTLLGYDELNRLTSVTGPDAPTCTPAVNCIGLKPSTVYAYSEACNSGATCAGLKASTVYEYDDSANLTKRTDPLAHITTSTFDLSERLIDTQSANNKHWTYQYDPDGNQTKQITARGNASATPAVGTITKTYNGRGLLTDITYGDGTTPNVAYTYDAVGRRLQMTDGAGPETYGYDDANRLTQVTRGTESFAYGYNPDSAVTSRTYPDGTVHSATFDNDGRLESVTSAGNATNFGYDQSGNLTTQTLPTANGNVISRTYDRVGRPTGAKSVKGTTTLVDVTQTLDDVGNPLTQTVTRAGAAPAGLVAAYNFDEGTGSTTLTDRSGTGNTGTLINGPTWITTGKYGGALQFDGTNDRINIPDANSLDLTSGMTIEAWVYPTAGTAQKTILEKQVSGSVSYGMVHNPSRVPEGGVATSAGVQVVSGNSPLALSTWTHVAITYDSTTVRLYVNGIQVATRATSGPIVPTTGPLSIGGNTIRPAEWFTGRIDDVRVYNRALSAAEITTDQNTPVANTYGNPTTNDAFQYDPADRLTKDCYATLTCAGATATATWSYDAVGNRVPLLLS